MDKAEEKREEKYQETLDNEYTVKFKKREWIVIHNLLATDSGRPRLYTLGDAKIVNDILDKIRLIADLTHQPEEPKEGVVFN